MTTPCSGIGETRHRSEPLKSRLENVLVTDSYGNDGTVLAETVVESESKTMTDVVTPCYRRRIAAGEVINNPMTYEHFRNSAGESDTEYLTHKTVPGAYISRYGGSQTVFWMGYPRSFATLKDPGGAEAKALSNIEATPYAFGEDAFEIRETLRFIRRPFSSIANILHDVGTEAGRRRIRRLTTEQRMQLGPRRLADVHAEVSWAAAPLVRSALSAAEALTDFYPTLPKRQTARGFANASTSKEESGQSGTTTITHWIKSHSINKQVHCQILYEVDNPLSDLNFRLGLRLKDVPLVLWQVMPLSFMYDRVVDVSTMISGLMNIVDPSVKILSGSRTIRTEEVLSHQLTAVDRSAWNSTLSAEPAVTNHYFQQRKVWRPSVSDTFPGVTAGLIKDAQSVTDLGAVIAQRLVNLSEVLKRR